MQTRRSGSVALRRRRSSEPPHRGQNRYKCASSCGCRSIWAMERTSFAAAARRADAGRRDGRRGLEDSRTARRFSPGGLRRSFVTCQYNSSVMSILKVARMGHPVLRAKARPIEPAEIATANVQRLVDDMIEYRGVGLAAPQVHEGLRLFVAALDTGDTGEEHQGARSEPIALINPDITTVGADTVEDWEGCLSIPDIRGRVPRAREITVRAFDRDGERIELHAHDFPARVIQHETDHLDGILFFDRMRSFETLTFLDEYSRYWVRGED